MTINKILPNYTDWNQRIFGEKINELVDAVNSLTGGEKEILCKVCNWSNHNLKDGICENCIKKIAVQELKSNTLRERIIGLQKKTVISRSDAWHNKYADQILSLVKEHLEKEWQELPAYTKNGENIMNKIRNL